MPQRRPGQPPEQWAKVTAAAAAAKHAAMLDRMATGKKRCSRCGQTLLIEEFSPSKTASDGHHGWCRPCVAAWHRERRQRRREIQARVLAELRSPRSAEPPCCTAHFEDGRWVHDPACLWKPRPLSM